MKIVYVIFIVFILCLVFTKQSPANVTLDGTCFERCVKEFDNTYLCRLKCTNFN